MATKTLTKQQWQALDDKIWRFDIGRLKIDGYIINIRLTPSRKEMNLHYSVYVNGEMRGEWTKIESEIGAKFWFEKKIKSGIKFARAIEKELGKKKAQKMGLGMDSVEVKTIGHIPYFSSFQSLKASLERNNDSIELIEE